MQLFYTDNKNKAKKVLLVDLYPFELRQVGGVLKGKCPFHEDIKTPNLCIYPETNSWYCFAGCGGGDSISFYMRFKKVDFKQAVKELIK